MKRIIELLRGTPGHPSHPPFTDATIGAFTTGFAMAVLGWLGVAGETLAKSSFLAVVIGLVFAVPTILTGFLDYIRIRRGTPFRRTAAIHWISTVTSTAVFLPAAAILQAGYESGSVSFAGAAVTTLAWLVLLFGGWVGGTIVFVYGMRVRMEPGTPTMEALRTNLPWSGRTRRLARRTAVERAPARPD